jgi:hypothetical protein
MITDEAMTHLSKASVIYCLIVFISSGCLTCGNCGSPNQMIKPTVRFTHFVHPKYDFILFFGIGFAAYFLQERELQPKQRLFTLIQRKF